MYQVPLMLLTDGYKVDHRRQYPHKTYAVYNNATARGSRIPGIDKTVVLGNQYFARRYLMELAEETFFSRPVDDVVWEYQKFLNSYLGPNDIGTDHIAALHDVGYMPLEIWAVPEGTELPLRMPSITMENTISEFFWLPNYFETLLSNITWMTQTSATTALRYRRLIDAYTAVQGLDPAFVQWQCHDFSFRGMSSPEAAWLSGMGHLASFTGTDTIPTLPVIDHYYPGDNGLVGGSVAATEHAVMMAGGELDERETYRRLLVDLYKTGIVSIVSDTWDFFKVLTEIIPSLKTEILDRDGKAVIRPDSGDPVKIICGDPSAPMGSPEFKGAVELLWETFGGTTSSTGHRTLDPHIGVIYGDSITFERCEEILGRLDYKDFSAANMVFGIGSYTYQYVTRDTFGFAIKATYVNVDDEERLIYKTPKTDSGVKNSARGRIALNYNDKGEIVMQDGLDYAQWSKLVHSPSSVMQRIWIDGDFDVTTSFAEIRDRLAR